jgi:hypothetical protein
VNSLFKEINPREKEVSEFPIATQTRRIFPIFQKSVEDAVSKLQIYVQQANISIENSTSSVINSMPAIANQSKLFLVSLFKISSAFP